MVGTAKYQYKTGINCRGSTRIKFVITIPYFIPISLLDNQLTERKINALGQSISSVLFPELGRKRNRIELRLVRLRYPYLDTSILAQYLAINADKYNFLRMKKTLFSRCSLTKSSLNRASEKTEQGRLKNFYLPTGITGVKVELSGRLTTQRSIPRKTVTNVHKGSLSSVCLGIKANRNKVSESNAA